MTCAFGQLDRIHKRWDHRKRYLRALLRVYTRYSVRAHSGHSVWRTFYNGEGNTPATSAGRIPAWSGDAPPSAARVRDLETALVRLQEENDALAAEVGHDLLIPVPRTRARLASAQRRHELRRGCRSQAIPAAVCSATEAVIPAYSPELFVFPWQFRLSPGSRIYLAYAIKPWRAFSSGQPRLPRAAALARAASPWLPKLRGRPHIMT